MVSFKVTLRKFNPKFRLLLNSNINLTQIELSPTVFVHQQAFFKVTFLRIQVFKVTCVSLVNLIERTIFYKVNYWSMKLFRNKRFWAINVGRLFRLGESRYHDVIRSEFICSYLSYHNTFVTEGD